MPESMAKRARGVLLAYYADFMDSWEPASESRFIPDLLARYVAFEAYLRERIAEANPALNEIGGLPRLDTLLRRVLPEFAQFLGVMADFHGWDDEPRANPPLSYPPVTSSWGNVRKVLVPTLDVHGTKGLSTSWERGIVKGERGR